ncbi:IS630 family transposase [Nostoc sp. CMAA1605]|uniref:IS630 family transposase n=1 Tax=Nostoc sp. CMAA1605 TaxID=2055159 RepID=UPI001F1D0680|nr:IS630 family transposase [Nostoc sp. CMAA1605]MCF4969839.1 IS630 family transposase [Nostoc sp. CMAA1605]
MINQHIQTAMPGAGVAIAELQKFIDDRPDAREVRKALAVKLVYQGYKYEEIQTILDVSLGSITSWKQAYEEYGISGLCLNHKGRKSYLSVQQREEVLSWLQTKECWELGELEYKLAFEYDVTYESKRSYYDLFDAAGISWKKTTKLNPKAEPEAVAGKKKQIETLLASRTKEIEAGLLRVLLIDECHLLWGDLSGYVWGKTDQEIAVPVVNERDKQTYYGAVDYLKGELLLKAYDAGNSDNTIDYLRYLLDQSPHQQLLIFWDGASYHRSHLVQDFLTEVNLGLPEEQWQIHCVRFAPNCPSQNPIEDIWLQAKTWVRRFCALIPSFSHLKWMFEWFIRHTTFDFATLQMYGAFSEIKY